MNLLHFQLVSTFSIVAAGAVSGTGEKGIGVCNDAICSCFCLAHLQLWQAKFPHWPAVPIFVPAGHHLLKAGNTLTRRARDRRPIAEINTSR